LQGGNSDGSRQDGQRILIKEDGKEDAETVQREGIQGRSVGHYELMQTYPSVSYRL
jgi:hypothetical protein